MFCQEALLHAQMALAQNPAPTILDRELMEEARKVIQMILDQVGCEENLVLPGEPRLTPIMDTIIFG